MGGGFSNLFFLKFLLGKGGRNQGDLLTLLILLDLLREDDHDINDEE